MFDDKEISKILIDHVSNKLGMFVKTVTFNYRYGVFQSVTWTLEETEIEDDTNH